MNSTILANNIHTFADEFTFQNEFRNKRFLITGATGLLGSIMVKCLSEINERYQLHLSVICPVRNLEKAIRIFGPSPACIRFEQMPLNAISTATVGPDIDFIIHFAAPTASRYFVDHPVETFRTIVDATENLLEYARTLTRLQGFVYVSSLEVYGSILDDSVPVTENIQGYLDPLDVRSSYPMAKRAAECLCRLYAAQHALPVTIARLTQTLGAGIAPTDLRVFAQFARCAATSTDIILHTEGTSARPYCYTTDAISALFHILLKGSSGSAYNVANESSYISIRHMAEFVRLHFAPQIKVEIIPQQGFGYAPTTRLKLDCTQLKQLGWTPHYDLQMMFQNLIEYLK